MSDLGARITDAIKRVDAQPSGETDPYDDMADAVLELLRQETPPQAMSDPVNPDHYRRHGSGIECIEITRHMGFALGNAVKYIWRADLKGNAIEDLEKARWYIDDEIAKRKATP